MSESKWPDWVKPGQRLAVVNRRAASTEESDYREVTITRVLKRDVVVETASGAEERFRDVRNDREAGPYLERYDGRDYRTFGTRVVGYPMGTPAADLARVAAARWIAYRRATDLASRYARQRGDYRRAAGERLSASEVAVAWQALAAAEEAEEAARAEQGRAR